MIHIVKAELYRIKYDKIVYICLFIALFFTASLCVNYEYTYIEIPVRNGLKYYNSWNTFAEYFFADYSMFYPLIIIVGRCFLLDAKFKIYPVIIAKGIAKKYIFISKLVTSFLITIVYFCINVLTAICIIGILGEYPYELDLEKVIIYLVAELGCYVFFSGFVIMICTLVKRVSVTFVVTIVLIMISYFYLTKIGTALDIEISLYEYSIIGFATNIKISSLISMLDKIPAVIIESLGFIYISYYAFMHNSFRKDQQ